jgi:uncharacterized protein
MRKLHLAEDLALPVDAATQTFLVVGKRGSGKSTTAARIVEQLLAAKIPVAVLDPVDSWYGLKASSDGKGQGHSVYVFGGRHADLPLEAGAGALIAEFLCEHRAPLVLSCKHLSGLERSRFMVDFAMTLYRKWTGGVLHLVLEEAHELAPQAPPKGEKAEEMLGAFKRLWKLGRSSGIGGTAVTQRPASLHKDITTQSEILVVHRTIGPQDVEAVKQWIKYHHQGEEILPELATLKTGEAFVWAPEFPEDKPIGLRRVQILPRETFDSASTPKAGEQRAEPKDLAPVDLDRLRSKMSATIERAKAEDPRELRKTIAELRAQLAKAQTAKPAPAAAAEQPRVVEKLTLREAQIERLLKVIDQLHTAYGGMVEALAARVGGPVQKIANEIKAALAAARDTQRGAAGRILAADGRSRAAAPHSGPAPVVSRQATLPRPRPAGQGDGLQFGAGERTVLTAVAQHQAGVTREQLTVLTGYKRSSRDTYLQRLRAAGLVDQQGETFLATDAGLAALGPDFEPLPTGSALREHWRGRLPGGELRLYEVLIDAYPKAVDRDALSEATDYKRSSRDTYLQRLNARQLIELVGKGAVRASSQLFEEA